VWEIFYRLAFVFLGVGIKKKSELIRTHSSSYGAHYQAYPQKDLYSRRDLNPHERNAHWILSPTCLPLPPPERIPDVRTRRRIPKKIDSGANLQLRGPSRARTVDLQIMSLPL
jgi:hypothetical protein